MKNRMKTDKGPGGAGSASKWLEFSKELEWAPSGDGNAHTGRGRGFVRLAATASALGLVLAVPGLVAANAVTAVADPAARVWRALPGDLTDTVIASKSEILDRNGNVIAEVWDEGRTNLDSLDGVSWYAQRALIDTEDQRFYEHQGYDPLGTARSALAHSGGGSGITQQLVKNLQFYNLAGVDGKAAATENTLARKIRELKYAVEYEKTHSKDEILLAYFNTVAFGDAGTYSVESASQRFFGVPASGLTLAQASLLDRPEPRVLRPVGRGRPVPRQGAPGPRPGPDGGGGRYHAGGRGCGAQHGSRVARAFSAQVGRVRAVRVPVLLRVRDPVHQGVAPVRGDQAGS